MISFTLVGKTFSLLEEDSTLTEELHLEKKVQEEQFPFPGLTRKMIGILFLKNQKE